MLVSIMVLVSCGDDGETQISPIDLTTEENIKEYLVGEWVSDKETLSYDDLTESSITCNMSIDEDLSVNFIFYNRETNETIGDYNGQIELDRYNVESNEAPDLISIDLRASDWPGGMYLFKHRTIYDGKRVMSWFFTGNGNCILDMLGDIDNFEYAPEEVIFEKVTRENLQLSPHKDIEFYAVFWGLGEDKQSLWIDEVQWTPTDEYDSQDSYPTRMTLYEDDMPGSSLYSISEDKISHILGNPIYAGEVYFVQTDKNSNIIKFEAASFN